VTQRSADPATRSQGTCHLCAQIAGDPAGDLLRRHLGFDDYRRALCGETAEFAVIPSIGPLVPGHVLLTPKRHVRSFVGLSAQERKSGDDVARRMAGDLVTIFGQPVHGFEHGSSRCGSTIACSVEHAHLHLVPADVEVWPLIENAGSWTELGSTSLAAVAGDREYLLYEHPDGTRLIWITNEAPIPSQFMRRAFATALGTPHLWDWRRDPRPEEIRTTLSCLSDVELCADRAGERVSA